MSDSNIWYAVGVIAFVTALVRFLPFALFNGKRKTPAIIEKLSKLLPGAVMGMLVVYCLKDVSFASFSECVPAIVAGLVVVVLHVWKRNTLISIICGTVCYMLMVQFVF